MAIAAIFIGKPGAGKSTLIRTLEFGTKTFDVVEFHRPYIHPTEGIPAEKTKIGYTHLYQAIANHRAQGDIVIEIGTGHPEFNIDNIVHLRARYRPVIFLCIAAADTCRQRALARTEADYILRPQELERRLERNFPNDHIPLLDKAGIAYHVLDTEQPTEKTTTLVRQYIHSHLYPV